MTEQLRTKFAGGGLARRYARLLIVLCLLTPVGASSLGLGDITLRSALNQPLVAEIALTSLGQTRGEDITVRLASPAAFENAGLDRSLLLTTLEFQVETGTDGIPYIKVTSPDAVKEPFLDFLVEIDWPNGRLLREYTLLLDPPVLIDEEPLPVEAALAGDAAVPAVGGASEGVAAGLQAATQAPAGARTAAAGVLDYGPVQRSDTLWSIASQLQPAGGGASVEQVMMALLQGNPYAFYNGNINELKAGYVLRVSDPALLTAMTRAAAMAEVRRQNEQWLDSKRARAGMAGAAPQGEAPAAAGDVAAAGGAGASGPRLRLSVPEATATGVALEGVAGEGEAGAPQQPEVARLKAELAAALETSAASRQENTELRERLAELQEQIDAMQRLTSLQDDTLAALQAGAGQKAAATGAPAPAVGAGEAKGVTPGDTAAKAARKPAPAREPAAADGLLDDPKLLALTGGVGVAVLGLIWLIVRRRRSTQQLIDEITEAESSEAARAEAPAWAAAAQTQVMASVPESGATVEAGGTAAVAEDGGLDLMRAEEDEIDVLAEADVYLAYRRFDKAEELLKEAIKADPGRRDLVLKLLEVHAASGNKSGFVAQAEAFKPTLGAGDAVLWDKVLAIGKRIAPEHALFGGALAAGATAAAGDAGLDLSTDLSTLDLDADLAAELDTLGSAAPAAEVTDGPEAPAAADAPLLGMDLSLDEQASPDLDDIALDNPPVAEASATQAARVSNVIDFESRAAGLGLGAADDSADAAGGGIDRDLDWLTGGGDLGSLEDAGGAEDDFSSLISGEDEVGTKLDLAKAYIDMGDQDSARNILSEVVQEGTQDQQREANELMRQIG